MTRALLMTLLLSAMPLAARAEVPSPVKTAELSGRLFATGVETQDPLLIIAAAKLRKTIAPAPVDRAAEGGQTADDSPLGWEEMLAAAEPLAEGDEALQGLISDVRAETTKGVASGPVYNIGSIGTGGRDTYPPIEFRGGEYAEVYVEAKSTTNLNLAIYDHRGRLVCSDTDVSHIAYCGWTPAEGGTFTLKVDNKGPLAANYALMTN
ncbi:MAG: hypothetical protein HC844_18440 [Tabrizicola sp.]|nr:hypothetical protein [Tabrizicola sp.]